MDALLQWDNGTTKQVSFDGTESGLFREVGKVMLDIQVPNKIDISCNHQGACVVINKRGYQMVNGMRVPAMHIDQNASYNHISLLPSTYQEIEMRCINPDGNNYKKYYFEPAGSEFYGRYGSIDIPKDKCRRTQQPYPNWMWEVLKAEKISKQYVDVTSITGAGSGVSVKKGAKKKTGPKTANEFLYEQLMAYAKHMVRQTLAAPEAVTVQQCKEARKYWNEMQKKKTVSAFNKWLCKLMMISPRKRDPFAGDTVKQYLARSTADFKRIINFEESLILAMEAVATNSLPNAASESFRSLGIHVWEATAAQKQEVMALLEPGLQGKVKKIYRVKPEKQEKKFSEYCKKNKVRKIKKFWHGSINANWFAILSEGLRIQQSAANGRMFGDGIYFAPSAHKAWGYTSYKGTRWANGNDTTAFMGVYATAYGNPWKVISSGRYSQAQVRGSGYHCVHAEAARTGLRADEVIFYDKDAVCMNYIVEFN